MANFEESYTLNDYLAAIKRRARTFLLVAIPIVAIATALALSLPNEYESYARISVDLAGTTVKTLEPMQVAAYADQYIAELRNQVLASDSLLPFAEIEENYSSIGDGLSLSERISLLRDGFFFRLETQPVTNSAGNEVNLISGFLAGYQGPEPEFAENAGKYFAAKFLDADRQNRTGRAKSTAEFLKDQIADTERRIVAHEQEVASFKRENACCLPELKQLNMSMIERSEREIELLQTRSRTLEQDRIFLQAQLEEIRKQSASTNRLALLEQEYLTLVANYGPDHPDVARVRRELQALNALGPSGNTSTELAALRMQLVEAEQKYSDIHPDVIGLKRRIASLESEQSPAESNDNNRLIENPRYLQLRSQINGLNTELTELQRRIPELQNKIETYEQYLIRTPQVESEFVALNRSLESARESFDSLQNRLVIARQTEAFESTEIGARLTQVRAANLPDAPSGPPRIAILVIGIFLAASAGVGAIIFAEVVDSTVRSSKDIGLVTQMVPLATIPVIQNSLSHTASRQRRVAMMTLTLVISIGFVSILVARLF